MGAKCALCSKGIMIGRQHKHHPGVAGGRWKKRAPKTQKIFRPNLHAAHIAIGGMRRKVKLCTKCLRRAREMGLSNPLTKPQTQQPLAIRD